MLDYIGSRNNDHTLKASLPKTDLIMQESGILDTPAANKNYTFQFVNNIPCPRTPTVHYEGQTYNTIQIYSQCWLKENLNAGAMIPGDQNQTDNGIIEKYCYGDNPDSCTKYGGLYLWNEMMQYTSAQGVQGIYPPGWHIPTDEEWNVLEGASDSQYGIGDSIWNSYGYLGYDAGMNLKNTSGWNLSGNGIDLFGFSGLPGGDRGYDGSFYVAGFGGYWWTSTKDAGSYTWRRSLNSDFTEVNRNSTSRVGLSVRCLRDF